MISDKQINDLISDIALKFRTKKIFLFGSYANGQANSDSDLDLCVIVDFKGKRKIELIREIRREINRYFKESLDLLLYENDEFYERAGVKNTLEYNILKNGIVKNG